MDASLTGTFFLVPADSERPEDYIKLSTIRHKIDERRKNCNVLFFIAGCRNHPREEPEKESRPRFIHDFEIDNDRYDKADLRQNFYLEFFACRPQETVEDARFLTQCLADPSLSVNDVVDKVRAAVVEATANKEQPCVGLSSMNNFHLHGQSVVASEYSHGLAGPCSSPAAVIATSLPLDGHKQWRVRINRLTVQSNITKPCILLLTDTGGDTGTKAFSHFEQTGMGPHYIIHLDGRISQLVEERLAAWCGNPAFWGTLQDRAKIPAGGFVNEVHYFAVSVALEGDGTSKEFSEVQYGSLVSLLREVAQRYDIRPWDVLGLSEVCMPPGKSRAPGRHFDWGKLADVSLTYGPPRGDLVLAGTGSESELRRLMEEWGYCLGDTTGFAHRLQSFCDRYQRLGSAYSQQSFAVWALDKLLRSKADATAQQ